MLTDKSFAYWLKLIDEAELARADLLLYDGDSDHHYDDLEQSANTAEEYAGSEAYPILKHLFSVARAAQALISAEDVMMATKNSDEELRAVLKLGRDRIRLIAQLAELDTAVGKFFRDSESEGDEQG